MAHVFQGVDVETMGDVRESARQESEGGGEKEGRASSGWKGETKCIWLGDFNGISV